MILNIKKQHYALFKSHIARTPGVFPLPDAVAADIVYRNVLGIKNAALWSSDFLAAI